MGCTSSAKLICAAPGVQVSRSLSRSRLPLEDAVTVKCALPGLMPASDSLSGKPNPGGVQACVDGSSAWSAAASACPVGVLLGVTVGGPLRPAGVQARDVDAALEAERADTVDLPVEVAGFTIGARFAHAREAAPGDEAVGRRRPPARDAVGRTVGPGCWAEYQDECESDRNAHLLRSLAEQFLAVN